MGNCKSLGRASWEEIFISYGNDLERQEDSSAFLSVGVEGWGLHSLPSASAVEVRGLIVGHQPDGRDRRLDPSSHPMFDDHIYKTGTDGAHLWEGATGRVPRGQRAQVMSITARSSSPWQRPGLFDSSPYAINELAHSRYSVNTL